MIDAASWMLWLKLAFFCGPFLLGILGMSLNLYIGNRYLDVMLDALKNSRHILIHSDALRCQGWFGRQLLVSKVSGAVIWSKGLVRSGEMDADDIRNFPAHLRRLIEIYLGLLASALIWVAIIYLYAKLR